ncbi:MAG TPA: DUF1707 domain-containing protein [Thermoleophilaceae bacterium]|nr:DUF1707 domain-containing protein [Thermoleophilaceae bacterium]
MTALLVSDREREYTVSLLRGHLVSGRLTTEEFEDRVAEAWAARYSQDLWQALRWLPGESPPIPPAVRSEGSGTAVGAFVLGLIGLFVLFGSFGLLFLISLPISVSAWGLGRSARRSGTSAPGLARAGEVTGVVGTLPALLITAGCAAILF